MVTTFFRLPLCKNGKMLLVTRWALNTLLFKVEPRLFLFESDGYLNRDTKFYTHIV